MTEISYAMRIRHEKEQSPFDGRWYPSFSLAIDGPDGNVYNTRSPLPLDAGQKEMGAILEEIMKYRGKIRTCYFEGTDTPKSLVARHITKVLEAPVEKGE